MTRKLVASALLICACPAAQRHDLRKNHFGEHLSYGSNEPIRRTDPTGLWDSRNCSLDQDLKLWSAIERAKAKINQCFTCLVPFAAKAWTDQIDNQTYYCMDFAYHRDPLSCARTPYRTKARWGFPPWEDRSYDKTQLTRKNFDPDGLCAVDPAANCLASTVAHEALHEVSPSSSEDEIVRRTAECVSCP